MKKNQNKLLFKKTAMLFLMMVLFIACDKDDDVPTNPVDQLPPATQTGAGTFGCLVNGVPYVDNSGFFNCFYQLVNGEYYFGIASTKDFGAIQQIVILSWMKEIETDSNISLRERANGNFFSEVAFNCLCPNAVTTSNLNGFIRFNNFTINPNIVSATFEFTVVDPTTGAIYEITEGRFDSFFTQ
uniref:hypothetical protein n=1 Tax=Flavobacterium sp. TaxID=239 RepID=UPI0040491265